MYIKVEKVKKFDIKVKYSFTFVIIVLIHWDERN